MENNIILLAASAPPVPDWFSYDQKKEVHYARELYYYFKKPSWEIDRWELEDLIKKSGKFAKRSMDPIGRGGFPYNTEWDEERLFQWPIYYAKEVLKRI